MFNTTSEIISFALREHRMSLTEAEAKSLCNEYSIPTPAYEIVRSEEDAEAGSLRLGFPLVAKVVSPQIIHKTNAGGVILNIRSTQEARTAFSTILKRVNGFDPHAKIDGVLLETLQPPGIEVIIGAIDDPQFGKTLMFGVGGVFVEAFHDVTFKLAPVTDNDVQRMLEEIQAHELLSGYRGSIAVDKNALARILQATSRLITENSEIVEIDFNPVIARENGAIVVDARIILSETVQSTNAAPVYPPESLAKFFNPDSVAVIGASATPAKIGYEVLRSVIQNGRKIYPINPFQESILGLKAYRSVLDVQGKVDLAVLTLPPTLVPSILDECGRKGVRAAIIVSGGFKEAGIETLERDTIATARRYGIRIIGPNCIGVLNGLSKLDTFFQSHERMLRPKSGTTAFITQSGTFGTTILEWAAEENVGISKFVSYGNRCDVDEGDLVHFFAQDKETSIIGIYVEGLENGRKLFEAARSVTERKPIVILKSGKTQLGSKAAKSHTGCLAGSYAVAKAAFEQAGMIVTATVDQLFDAVKVLSMQPLPEGLNLVMVTNGAGPCVMAADKIDQYRLKIASLSQTSISELTKALPSYCFISDTTVDLTGSATSNDYEAALQILADDSAVHVLMPFFVFQDTPLDERIVDVLQQLKKYHKPIICCAAGGPYTRMMIKRIEALGIPVYETAERAVDAANSLVHQAEIAGKIVFT
ncbi:MAG: acetate--CoA ligase family protein [Candidatus Bathyarchaeia archaeon]